MKDSSAINQLLADYMAGLEDPTTVEPLFSEIRREIEERDRGDATRAVSPLRQAEDAEYIDTSDLTAAQVVALLKRKIQEKV